MMERNFYTDALVLSSRIFGESNRILTILTPDRGVFDAILYGGRKSKLRSLASPFHTGTMWFYNDEAKHSVKITDFDAKKFRPSLHENLYKTMAASFCCELLIKTRGGNEDSQYSLLWVLTNGFLDGLELIDDKGAELGLLRFIWRFLAIQGEQPDIDSCCVCDSSFEESDEIGNSERNMLSCIAYYDVTKQGFLCQDCSAGLQSDSYRFPLSAEACNYLRAVNNLSPKEVRQIMLHTESVHQMHDVLMYLAEKCAGSKLQTLESAKGIL
ncbi:MAG: DNA repair protein RecO [Spirochaetaceae bacterium]|nr:DNA repair protein RecO [Spirochaetaceae bacterium]